MKKKVKVVFNRLKTKRKVKRRTFYVILTACIFVGLFSYFTNPFVRFSVIVDPFHSYEYKGGQLSLNKDNSLFVKNDPFLRVLAWIKSGWLIVGNRFWGGPMAVAENEQEIIAQIHELRFNPERPFLISGDHFSVFYPRSLGIFYNSAIDWRIALNKTDWRNRQLLYLKTVAYALQVFEETDRLSTTVVPVAPRSVVLIDVYSPPSDTLYSLLYALRVLQDTSTVEKLYPYHSKNALTDFPLETSTEANKLLVQFKPVLKEYLEKYTEYAYDPNIGLIGMNITLSGTKDIAKHRQSSFYDNVVFWRTHQLAQELEIVPADQKFLDELKTQILTSFWDEETGVFLEDLGEESKTAHAYSSDWLIVPMTGFLDPANPTELPYLIKIVDYIQENEIDEPFGVKYENDKSKTKLAGLPKWLAPSYGTTAIWSHWGQEYTKLLIRLNSATGETKYLDEAKKQLDAYSNNITKHRGYPEVYDAEGKFFQQTLYRSVRQTGWVVNYEQARAMYESAVVEKVVAEEK